MDKQRIKKALREVAKQNGVSVAEVEREITLALQAAQENPSPEVQAAWDKIPRRGETPTTEEVMGHVIGNLMQDEEFVRLLQEERDQS